MRRSISRALFTAMALAAVAPTVPAAQAAEAVSAPAGSNGGDKAPLPAPQLTANQIRQLLASDTYLVSERKHPIWLGKAKRGNRRGRARWNYNR